LSIVYTLTNIQKQKQTFDANRQRIVIFGGCAYQETPANVDVIGRHDAPESELPLHTPSRADNGDRLLNDVVLIELTTWSSRVVGGGCDEWHVPLPRQGCFAAQFDDQLFVYGGETSIE
jgi:hypothetical protein